MESYFKMSIYFSLLGIILCSVLFCISDRMFTSFLYIPLVLFVIFCVFLCYIKDNNILRRFWLRPSLICFLSLCIVGFQLCIDHVLGYSNLDSTVFAGASGFADQCFYSSAIFVFAYIIGLGLVKSPYFNRGGINTTSRYAFCWLFFMLLFFIMFVFSINIDMYLSGEVYVGSGSADFIPTISSSFERIYQILFYVTLACYLKLIRNSSNGFNFINFIKGFPCLFWITVLLYLILRLLSGDRGPVIYNTLALIYGFVWCTKYRFRLVTVICALIVGAITVSFLGYYRSRDPELPITEKIVAAMERQSEIDKKSIINPTLELAYSVDTHFMAVRDIYAGNTTHSLGSYTVLSLTHGIPGLKKQYLLDLGLEPSELSSAEYFSISSQGVNYVYGEGSSMFGEAFLEFNLFGMMIYGFLLGIIFKWLDFAIMQENQISILSLSIVMFLASHAIYMGRTSFAIEMSSIVYMCVVFYLFNTLIRRVFK